MTKFDRYTDIYLADVILEDIKDNIPKELDFQLDQIDKLSDEYHQKLSEYKTWQRMERQIEFLREMVADLSKRIPEELEPALYKEVKKIRATSGI